MTCKVCSGPHATPLCDNRNQARVGLAPVANFAAPWGYYSPQVQQLSGPPGQMHHVNPSGAQSHAPSMVAQQGFQPPSGSNAIGGQAGAAQTNMYATSQDNMFNPSSLGYSNHFNNQLNPFSPQYQPPTQSSSSGFQRVRGGSAPPGVHQRT